MDCGALPDPQFGDVCSVVPSFRAQQPISALMATPSVEVTHELVRLMDDGREWSLPAIVSHNPYTYFTMTLENVTFFFGDTLPSTLIGMQGMLIEKDIHYLNNNLHN